LTSLDSKKFKETERQNWDRVAAGWQKWWPPMERGAEKVNRRLIELAMIKSGSRLLDVATGIGEPAITAANKLGNDGYVLAIDISPKMLAIAKQRAISLGLQDVIEFKEGDIETIKLPSSRFDAVLSRWGLMLLPDLNAALSNIYRSLKEGGHFASAVWASPNQDSLCFTSRSILFKETNTKPPPPGAPGIFSLSDENSLKNSFITSEFKDVATERINVSFDFDSPGDFTGFTSETSGFIQKLLADQPMERKKQILRAITDAAVKYADKTTGKTSLENETILIVGMK
jgi:ubiquinone/menaquinone biosynthesis C-methylase UbiE